MELKIFSNADEASIYIAKEIAELIAVKNSNGEKTVLGLATGNTPIQVYKELISLHKEGLSFRNVITFNLDEYYPMNASRTESYHVYMNKHFFDHVDVLKENINIPDGSIPGDYVSSYCAEYEQKIFDVGGIDIQLLGIGRTGHIGFNEPGSSKDSITRLIKLDETTREDAAKDFKGLRNVPKMAITMGIKTILSAKKIYLLSLGNRKAKITKECLLGEISSDRPASFLQNQEAVEIILDEKAGMLIHKDKIN
tara:strand:- start:21875 stop:22633 length:759 start_codon:yes stop_codon:yes gene_type:complete